MYKEHIVAFMDILGFKQLISNAGQSIDDAMLIINKLTNSIEMVMEENRFLSDINYRIFSDCICISYDISNEPKDRIVVDIRSFLEQIICIQAQLVLEGIFLRGGICIDNHFENENIIFSQALVKAYELESTKALYPRILVDDSVIEYLKKNNISNSSLSFEFYEKISKDLDGLNFVDYLGYCSALGIEDEEEKFFKNHKQIIEARLRNESDPNVLQKYLWLTRYHNFKVREEDLSEEYIIGGDIFLFFNKDVFIQNSFIYNFKSKLGNIDEGLIFTYAYSGKEAKEKIQSYIKKDKLDYEVDYNNIVLSIQDELSMEQIDNLYSCNKIDNRIKIIYAPKIDSKAVEDNVIS